MKQKTIAILGAGSWGTAVAIHLAQIGHRVLLWAHNPQHVALMIEKSVTPAICPILIFQKPYSHQPI